MENTTGYLLYAKNQRVLDGSSRMTVGMRRHLFALGACTVFFIGGCFIGRSAIKDFKNWQAWRQIKADGISIQATVKELANPQNPWNGGFYVDYEFEIAAANGPARFGRMGTTNEETFAQLRRGGHVLVMYSASDPIVSRIPGGRTTDDRIENFRWQSIITGIISLGFVSLSFIPLVALTLLIAGEIRLLRHGRTVKGHVVGCSEPIHDDGSVKFELSYRFCSPSGTEVQGKQQVQYSESESRVPPTAGTELHVLCADEKRHEVL